MTQSGTLPVEGLEDAIHDAFLAFEAEGVDAVHEVDAQVGVGRDLADAAEAGVEVAFDLERECAVVEGLGEFAEGDFAGADEDDALHFGEGGEHGEAGAGVAGGGAGDAFGLDHAGMGEGGGHAVVLEAAAGVEAFVLKHQLAGPHADLPAEEVGLLHACSAFADGDHVVFGVVEGEEFAEAPDAGEVEAAGGFGALGVPAVLEKAEAFGDGEA